jgi:hypothetical protein
VELTVDQTLCVCVASILLSFSFNACLEMMISCAMLLSYFTSDFTVRSKKNVCSWHKMVYLRESTFYCSNHGISFLNFDSHLEIK